MRTISVILATYNRCKDLKVVLEDLLEQETDNTFAYDVIVVDNNSKDNTKQVVESCFATFNSNQPNNKIISLKYMFESKQGKSHALNLGIKEASGELIALTDDDVTLDSKWLISIVNCFDKHNCDCVGGRVLPIYPPETPPWVKKYKRQMAGVVVLYDYGEETKKLDSSMDLFIGANCAFKKYIFDECGVFRLDLSPGRAPVGEDLEYFQRLIDNGKSLFYCGQALMWHPVNLSRMKFKNLAHWHKELGRYSARREHERENKGFVYWFGVPRYLIKGAVKDLILLLISVCNRRLFFNSTRAFFRKYGMIQEYRVIYKEKG